VNCGSQGVTAGALLLGCTHRRTGATRRLPVRFGGRSELGAAATCKAVWWDLRLANLVTHLFVCLSVCGAVTEIDELWQQICRIQELPEGDESWQLDRGGLLVRHQTGELWPRGSPWGPKKVKVQKIVTLFSYTVWPTAMKFGMVRGLAKEHLLAKFGELWPTFPVAKIFNSGYRRHFFRSATRFCTVRLVVLVGTKS